MMEGTAAAMADADMDELLERSGAAEDAEAQLRELYHNSPLLVPEADFIVGQYQVLSIHYIWFNCMKAQYFLLRVICFRFRALSFNVKLLRFYAEHSLF